ncbi:unnamed protein product [Victoria cruziana]
MAVEGTMAIAEAVMAEGVNPRNGPALCISTRLPRRGNCNHNTRSRSPPLEAAMADGVNHRTILLSASPPGSRGEESVTITPGHEAPLRSSHGGRSQPRNDPPLYQHVGKISFHPLPPPVFVLLSRSFRPGISQGHVGRASAHGTTSCWPGQCPWHNIVLAGPAASVPQCRVTLARPSPGAVFPECP